MKLLILLLSIVLIHFSKSQNCDSEPPCDLFVGEDGCCVNGPDLKVSANTILNSLEFNDFTSSDECLVAEGCITGTGTRTTLRFTTTISNYGNEDFYIGQSGGAGNLNPNFYWDDCHGHAHYEGYANYQLYDYPSLQPRQDMGHKNGWCVMDLGAAVSSEAPDYTSIPNCQATYGCSTMGISKGCSDTYGSGISCQWIDVTGIEDNTYVLGVTTNMRTENYEPMYEVNYENNAVYIKFTMEDGEITDKQILLTSINTSCYIDEFSSEGISSEGNTCTDGNCPIQPGYTDHYYFETIQLNLETETVVEFDGVPDFISLGCENCDNNDDGTITFPSGRSCFSVKGVVPDNANEISFSMEGDLNFNFESVVYVSIKGCTNELAYNYNPGANVNDGSCEMPNLGCTDILSLNYDPTANFEDGSCEYCLEGIEWVATINYMDTYGDGWNGSVITITGEDGTEVFSGTKEDGSSDSVSICLSNQLYQVYVSEGGFPDEVSFDLTVAGRDDLQILGGVVDTIYEFDFREENCDFAQEIVLTSGWNLIGTYMNPIFTQPGYMFRFIKDKIEYVKNMAGEVYLPKYDFDSIGSIGFGEGFKIKINKNLVTASNDNCGLNCVTYYACGVDSTVNTNTITYNEGWNMFGILQSNEASVDILINENNNNNLIIIKDGDGNSKFFLPEDGTYSGELNVLEPSKGYIMKLSDSLEITWGN